MMAMGDALAFSVYRLRSFTKLDFALSHPAGALGKRLLLEARDIMCTGDKIPVVKPSDLLKSAIITISQGGLGLLLLLTNRIMFKEYLRTEIYVGYWLDRLIF